MKISLILVTSVTLFSIGCGPTIAPECEKFVSTHACGKTNLPTDSQQKLNDSCLSITTEQRERIVECVEQSNYCDLYNDYQIGNAIKVSVSCFNKAKSTT